MYSILRMNQFMNTRKILEVKTDISIDFSVITAAVVLQMLEGSY